MKCDECGTEIPVERLEAVPDTRYCVKCADKHGPKPKVGFMVFGHKTAPELVMIDGDDEESLRRARNADERNR